MRARLVVQGIVACCLLALAGCGGDDARDEQARTPPPPARTATPEADPAPPAAPAGRPIRFRASDGVRLRGTLVPGKGSRAPAVVLVHQSDGGPDQFDEFVPYLHDAGYAALTYLSREEDRLDEVKNARDVAGAVRAVRQQRGVDPDRVAVVGASIGAASAAYLSFQPAGRGLRAVVGLSPAPFFEEPPRGRRPHDVLLIADESERPDAEFIAEGSPGIEVRTSPVSGHGVALLPDEHVRDEVLDWLAERLAGRDG